MKKYLKLKNLAFTLAEVLITLGIIGTVAEMTIPTLIHDVRDQATKVQWKKEFSSISQVVQMIALDNGGWFAGGLGPDDPSTIAVFSKYLKVARTCTANIDITSDSGGCWANPAYYSKGHLATTQVAGEGMVLVDGTFITLYCNKNFPVNNVLMTPNSVSVLAPTDVVNCSMLVDVNGFKKPNTYGEDIFGLLVYPSAVVKPYSSATMGELKKSATKLTE